MFVSEEGDPLRNETTEGWYHFDLDGSGSDDPDGQSDITSYEWEVVNVTSQAIAGAPDYAIIDTSQENTTFFIYDDADCASASCSSTYDIDLTVSDGEFSDTDDQSSAVLTCSEPSGSCTSTVDGSDGG